MGEPLRNIYPHATRFQVFKWKAFKILRKALTMLSVGSVAGGLLYLAFIAGAYFKPVMIYAANPAAIVIAPDPEYPVLDRIAKCESSSHHNASSGMTLLHANSDGSVDIGLYQINNLAWGKKATQLGYDLFTEAGNRAMALYIYKNAGTEPWYSSAKCWNK